MAKTVEFKRYRAHTTYRLKDGTKVPGTTTICGLLDRPALRAWANRIGLEGYEMDKYLDPLAGVGTLTHARILAEVSGGPLTEDISEYSAKEIDLSDNAMLKLYEWRKQHKFGEVVGCEMQLVSEQYRYGGTLDCLCELDGKLTLIDYKTGSGIYPDMAIQLAAYRWLVKENLGLDIDRAMIVNIGRTPDEDYNEKPFTNAQLDAAWELFLHLRAIYDLKKQIGA
jgi:hypothetical protein